MDKGAGAPEIKADEERIKTEKMTYQKLRGNIWIMTGLYAHRT